MLFEVNNLYFSYYKSPMTVQRAKFSFDKNEKVLLLASNEMGKSTMLKVLSGFDETYLGSVTLNGKEIKGIDDGEKNFSLVLDNPVLFENKSIKFNIDYLFDVLKKERPTNEEVESMLEDFGINHKQNEKISKLSLLEKRLFAILRSDLKNPTILFLDDQFDGLNESEKNIMLGVYEKILLKENSMVIALSDDSYKTCKQLLNKNKFKKVLYLCDGELFVFSSIDGFEKALVRKNAFQFVDKFETIDGLIIKTNKNYIFYKENVREIEIDKSLYKNLDDIKLETGETEKVSLYFKGNLDLENLTNLQFNKKILNNEVLVYFDIDGKKVF